MHLGGEEKRRRGGGEVVVKGRWSGPVSSTCVPIWY